jgi:hypothetical protein
MEAVHQGKSEGDHPSLSGETTVHCSATLVSTFTHSQPTYRSFLVHNYPYILVHSLKGVFQPQIFPAQDLLNMPRDRLAYFDQKGPTLLEQHLKKDREGIVR